MKETRKIVVGLVVLAALAGCQQPQPKQTAPAAQDPLLTEARAELSAERADREAEITVLQQQYHDILKQRETEIATLQAEIATLKAKNAELRDKIRAVRRDLDTLQKVMGPGSGSSPSPR